MIRFITIIIIILNTFVSSSFATILKDVKIDGNQRISKETIIILGDIKINAQYENNDLNIILKNLYESGFFENVDIFFENNILNINVVENYIIEDIKIQGVKNSTLVETFLDNIQLKNRMSFTEFKLNEDINLIQNILKKNGYYFSKINASITKDENLKSINLSINVDQGPRAKIKEISFIGDKNIKDKKLLQIIASEEHKFWKFISNKVYLNQAIIELDKRLIENYYKNLGYFNVEVINSFAQYDNEGDFKLIFNINSGKKYFFNNLTLLLDDNYNTEDFSDVYKLFDKLKNEVYSLDDFNLILEKIDNIASSRLYDFIDAIVLDEIVDDKINFTFKIVDSKKFYVEKINILGNYQTYEEVIRNKLIVDEGDPLNKLLLNKSLDNIRSLRIFKNVDSKIKDGSNENLKIIDLTLEEEPTGEISLAAGVGTSGSIIGGGIVEKNFLGKGIRLNTNFELSEETLKGQFIYSRPNFGYTDNTLNTGFVVKTNDFLSDFGYKISEKSLTLGTEYEQLEKLFFSPEFTLSLEDLKTNASASSQLKKQEGNYQDFYFNYGFNYDLRNSTYRPSSGYFASFFQELPLISDNKDFSNTLIYNKYKQFSKASDTIGKASLYLKSVSSFDSDVRISKRAQAPYSRLRGFEKGKIGPIDNDDYIGGNNVAILNLSTDIPSILNTIENIDFTYFIDIANVWGVDYDNSIDDGSFLRSSTGIGMDLLTPIGPLNFSLTKPITKKSSDKTETFRFNLGTTF